MTTRQKRQKALERIALTRYVNWAMRSATNEELEALTWALGRLGDRETRKHQCPRCYEPGYKPLNKCKYCEETGL